MRKRRKLGQMVAATFTCPSSGAQAGTPSAPVSVACLAKDVSRDTVLQARSSKDEAPEARALEPLPGVSDAAEVTEDEITVVPD